ncbi:insulinase family protein [Pseudomonas syringae]|nr:insulinase family protein [Pseudomonas syringae]MCF5070597.1 insulinase family protein [Pseudomonas syringae]
MDILRSWTLLLLCLTPMLARAAPPPTTHSFMLDNGLKVIVREDHRAPLVTSQLWFKVGSSDEAPGQSGLSHALEHMLYQGSSKTCRGEASHILQTLGARENAFTGKDFTAYYQTLEPRYLNVALELMADLMSTALLREEDLTTEMAVIREERRMYSDDADDLAQERLLTLAYPASSYRTPIIGWMHDLDRMDVTTLRHWYKTRYMAANATLVIAGDVTADQVKPLAERFFGGLARTAAPAPPRPLELAQPGERKLTLQLPVASPRLIMTFNVPGMATAESRRAVHALRLIDVMLGGSLSARLQKRLQYTEQVFSTVSTFYNPLTRGDSLLQVSAELAGNYTADLDAAQARIWQLIEELQSTPPALDELDRARTQLFARQVYAQDSIVQQATELALLSIVDLPLALNDEDADELSKVTPQDIRQAAMTYLTRDRLSVAHVLKETAHE